MTSAPDGLAWLGEEARSVRILAEIVGTVDLERALADLRAGQPDEAVAEPADAVDDPLLGARVVLLGPRAGSLIALAEPTTEGRLAAGLARHGEGRLGRYVEAPVGLDAVRARAAAAGVVVSRRETGPFGPSVLVLGGPIGGPLVILAEPAAVPSPP